MTTDDGLKGLTDRQWYELWNFISSQEIDDSKVAPLPLDYFGNLGRQWLAANVHDSGDGVSLASISIGLQNFYDSQAHLHEGSNNTHSAKLIHVNEAMQFILRADAAILAEKGEV